MTEDIESKYDNYEWLTPLAEGENSTVYLVKDKRANKPRVVKQVLNRRDEDGVIYEEDFTERKRLFARECQLLPHMNFAGIAKYVESFEADGRYFLVLEYVEGNTWTNVIRNYGPVAPDDAVKVAIQVCEILEYLHDSDPCIIHCDLKPSNLMLTPDGQCVLVDLRKARVYQPSGVAPRPTSAYAAPEHYFGKPCPKSDLYSLGKFVAFLLTGIEPAQPGSFLRGSVAGLPPSLENLLGQLTSPRLEDRPASARNVRHILFRIYQEMHPDFEIPEELMIPDVAYPPGAPKAPPDAPFRARYSWKEEVKTFRDDWWRMYQGTERATGANVLIRHMKFDSFVFSKEDMERLRKMLADELQILSRVDHPGCIKLIYECEEEEDQYLVFDWLDATCLTDHFDLQVQTLSESEVIDIGIQTCDILSYLHSLRPAIIYKDLRPITMAVTTDGAIKLVNFGLAKQGGGLPDNIHVVTQGYSPPEAYWGDFCQATDVYSLGATMYYLLTGKEPLALSVSSPRSVNGKISKELDEVVQKATAQDISARYPSANQLKVALKNLSRSGSDELPEEGKPWWRKLL